METVREKLESMLVSKGMFESQAKKVLDKAIPKLNSLVENYHFTFDSPSDEYPEVIYNVLFSAVKPIALEWIEENIPLAWYKPMFQ